MLDRNCCTQIWDSLYSHVSLILVECSFDVNYSTVFNASNGCNNCDGIEKKTKLRNGMALIVKFALRL